jgi:hypothetical protein
MQQHQHHYIDRRLRLMDSSNKTRNDEFYAKLERIRLTAAASSSSKSLDFNNTLILSLKSHFSSSRSQSNKILLFFTPFASPFRLNNVLLRLDYDETAALHKLMIRSFLCLHEKC